MEEKAKASEKAPKNSFFNGLKAEFKKIIWPDRDSIIKQSTAVVLVSVILGIVITIFDMGIKFGVEKILQIG